MTKPTRMTALGKSAWMRLLEEAATSRKKLDMASVQRKLMKR
jgi:hypothetical protein